jgi:hypothetical protein
MEPSFYVERLEATSGIEPLIEILQTSALPLGYVAWGTLSLPMCSRGVNRPSPHN